MAREIITAGLELIKSFEQFRSHPYQDQAGVWTIGYGSTYGVTADTAPITKAQAVELLNCDVANAERAVSRGIRTTLNDNQYAALVSLVFNCGNAPLLGTLGRYLNQQVSPNYAVAADEFLKWNHVDGRVSAGLTRRREAERDLFLTV